MSYSTYITKIFLVGEKASVIQMLNTAIKNTGIGDVVTPEDGVGTINGKFHYKDEDGYEKWHRFLIHDFLDMECIDNDAMKQRRKAFEEECEKEDTPNVNYDYAVVVKNVIDNGDEYEVELSLGEDEYEGLCDWANWTDLTEVYGVKIYADLFDDGTDPEFCGTTIYELAEGSVKTTKIEPSIDYRKFSDGFNALIELNPQRYKAIMIETLESEIESLQKTVQEVKRSLNNDSLKENRGNTEHPDDKQDDSWIDEVLG